MVSAVRCNDGGRLGFTADRPRLNVAITRAARACVLVGDQRSLRSDATWSRCIDAGGGLEAA